MTLLYLDVCAICRPFDNQENMRIRLETDAMYLIMSKIQDGKYSTVTSPVHELEISAISNTHERTEIFPLLSKFASVGKVDIAKLRNKAELLHTTGFGAADAAHLAYAEEAADIFITCDDKLLKKGRKEKLLIAMFNPVEFVMNEDLQ